MFHRKAVDGDHVGQLDEWVIPTAYQIPVGVLSAALVKVAVNGNPEQTLDNMALLRTGQEAGT